MNRHSVGSGLAMLLGILLCISSTARAQEDSRAIASTRVVVSCPQLSAEQAAALEARARADLLSLDAVGALGLGCSGGLGRIRWVDEKGATFSSEWLLSDAPSTRVEQFLSQLVELLESCCQTGETGSASEAEQDDPSEPALEQDEPEPAVPLDQPKQAATAAPVGKPDEASGWVADPGQNSGSTPGRLQTALGATAQPWTHGTWAWGPDAGVGIRWPNSGALLSTGARFGEGIPSPLSALGLQALLEYQLTFVRLGATSLALGAAGGGQYLVVRSEDEASQNSSAAIGTLKLHALAPLSRGLSLDMSLGLFGRHQGTVVRKGGQDQFSAPPLTGSLGLTLLYHP